MGDKSKIAWTDATWNPVTGCTKVSSGCRFCYAERDFHRPYPNRKFTDVRCHPERLDYPLRWCKPRRVFVNSMSDLFHEDVPDEFILRVFDVMRQCENGFSGTLGRAVSQHTFQILTKRAARMRDFCTRLRFAQNDARGLYLAQSLPHNGFNPMNTLRHVQLGVSVEDQATADERIPLLLDTPAALRFVSYEPALGPIDVAEYLHSDGCHTMPGGEPFPAICCSPSCGAQIDWVIAGGESGPKARPCNANWIRDALAQCRAARIPCFVKQMGYRAYDDLSGMLGSGIDGDEALAPRYYRLQQRAGNDPAEWPPDLRVQEFPR